MFHVLLIILLSINFSISNNPILIAWPYPFNTSESSRIECFTNDQGIILSLTIIATILDIDKTNPSLKYSKHDITKNGSIILILPVLFNYSELHSEIEYRLNYHHSEQKVSHLELLSVVEIPQKDLFSINTYTKQLITINCLAYGTNVCKYEK
jgi:hypothetical protein